MKIRAIQHKMTSSPEPRCFVFRTTFQNQTDLKKASEIFDTDPAILDWYVDLDDRDKVLRVECENHSAEIIIQQLKNRGISAEELPL